MILDRNICSKCKEKNFRDEDYMYSNAVCKKCYQGGLDEKEEVIAYRQILRLINLDIFKNASDNFVGFIIVSFVFVPFTFQYENWWFLKAVGVLFLFSFAFAMIFEGIENGIIYRKLKTLKENRKKISVSEEIYQQYNEDDIYSNFFIVSKKENTFTVIDIKYLKQYKKSILSVNKSEMYYVFRTIGIGITIYIGLFIFFHWIGNNSSVYTNTIKPIDLTKQSNWIIPSKKSCEAHDGIFNQALKECKANWMDAKLICKDNSSRLATFDEYKKSDLFSFNNGQWTNTTAGTAGRLLFNATLGLLPKTRDLERFAEFAYSNEITNLGLPKGHPTDEKRIVKCVKGTSNYYLRNFDTK